MRRTRPTARMSANEEFRISRWPRNFSRSRSLGVVGALGQLKSLPRQELPASVLLLPDLQCANPDAGGLAVGFGFGRIDMARDRGIADHRDTELGKVERLDDCFPAYDAVDELGFRLDLAVRMAIAHLIGRYLLQLGFIRLQQRLSQRLDGLVEPHRRMRQAPQNRATGSTCRARARPRRPGYDGLHAWVPPSALSVRI